MVLRISRPLAIRTSNLISKGERYQNIKLVSEGIEMDVDYF